MHHLFLFFFFSSRRRHTRCSRDWSSDVCSSDLRSESSRSNWASDRASMTSNAVVWPPRASRLDEKASPALPASDRKSTRLNSSHGYISYAVFCLKKKKKNNHRTHTRAQNTRI